MILQAKENYTKMVQTIEPTTLHVWEHQIQLAEQNRVKDIKAMDIYSAQIPSTAGPAITVSGPASGLALDSEPSLQDQWMEFALVVKEAQCVYFML